MTITGASGVMAQPKGDATMKSAEIKEFPGTHAAAPKRWEGLGPRVASGLVLAAIVTAATLMGGVTFIALALLAAIQMQREWERMTAGWGAAWRLGGAVYALLPCLSLIWLREYYAVESDVSAVAGDVAVGATAVLFLIGTVAATDIGAYFSGRLIGGPKLAPAISPKKTWAGLIGGMAMAGAAGAACAHFADFPGSVPTAAIVGALLAAVSQMGDLFESWIKRKAGVKDSGTLIPGHGGLLDRVDGLAFAAPCLVALAALMHLG